MIQTISAIASIVNSAILIFGGLKIYYALYEYPPHRHTERGEGKTLTTDGVLFPRGTKNGN